MVKAIVVRKTGGPEVMSFEEIEVGEPGPGEVRLRHTAIGVNFIDTYYRKGLYPAPAGFPFVPGNEGAGTVVGLVTIAREKFPHGQLIHQGQRLPW